MSVTGSLSAERTGLAWRRTALTALGVAAVAARAHEPAAGAVLAVVAVACWALPGRRPRGEVVALVSGLQVLAGLVLMVLVLG